MDKQEETVDLELNLPTHVVKALEAEAQSMGITKEALIIQALSEATEESTFEQSRRYTYLVGDAGMGKTTVAQTMAKSLGKKAVLVSPYPVRKKLGQARVIYSNNPEYVIQMIRGSASEVQPETLIIEAGNGLSASDAHAIQTLTRIPFMLVTVPSPEYVLKIGSRR